MTTRPVEYRADGTVMIGHLAVPAGTGRRPGVLIGHEGIGLNDVQRRRADQLAERGYVAFAMDYHGGRWFSDPAEMMARLEPLLADPDRMREIGRAAFDVLCAEPCTDTSQIAAVGYGAGGTIALELGRDGTDLRAIAAVNPVLETVRPQDSANIDCPVLVCIGSEDPIAPLARRHAFAAEMQAAGIDWQLIIYGGAEHAFHLPPLNADGSLSTADAHEQPVPGIRYHHRHAQRSWRAILDLLDEVFSASNGRPR
ncbi:MAG TPA: dienelactone hydrolase family protein [Jatrophihabitantaceae bacterium]